MTLRSSMTNCRPTHRLGLDIGGANIKLYHSAGHAICIPFPMWLRPASLADELVKILSGLPRCETWGVTMTGELADVFADRAEGVRAIVEQTMIAARQEKIEAVGFYASPGTLLTASEAVESSESVASANWHALAYWTTTWITEPSLLIDIGSTTADIIPISPGRVATPSRTDHDRLCRRELVYLGIRRTPVCSLVDTLPFNGAEVPVMRERFATTDDCALLLGWSPEAMDDVDTSDACPRTRPAAANRLARMIGLDHLNVSLDEAVVMASRVMQRATELVSVATSSQAFHNASQWVVSGHARQLIESPTNVTVIDLASRLGSNVSRVAPAFAICELIRSGVLSVERTR